jgi:hypothetical protein
MTKRAQRSSRPSNFFGGIGYISVISQWLWSIALILPSILENESLKNLLLPQHTEATQAPVAVFDENSLLMIIVAAVVTLVVLIITIVVLIRLPIALVRTSQKTVTHTVETLIPTITHHKPVSKKKRAILSTKLRVYIKLALCLVPVIPLVFVSTATIGLDSSIALLVGTILAIGSTIWFLLQYSVAKMLKIPFEQLL